MRWGLSAALLAAFGTGVGGCASTMPGSDVAVGYNRMFEKSRDEVLVTNILRASAREPLQFSTMGTVTGGVSPTGEVSLPFSNVFAKDGLKLTLKDEINPALNIVPLENKDFAEGVLKPVSLDTINFFLAQGWDPEFVFQLAIGGVACPDGKLVLNRGEPAGTPGSHYDEFVAMLNPDKRLNDPNYRLEVKPEDETPPHVTTIRMPAKDAVALLKEDAVGKGRKLKAISSVGQKGELVEVQIADTPDSELVGVDTSKVCGGAPAGALGLASSDKNKPQILLRSVESMIFYLGETQRSLWGAGGCETRPTNGAWPYYERIRDGRREKLVLLRLHRTCSRQPTPFRTFAQTSFHDQYYYALRQEDAGEGDRTLSTLTFLNELIALQTNPSSITSAAPVVDVSPK